MPTFIRAFGFSPCKSTRLDPQPNCRLTGLQVHTQLFTMIPYSCAAIALPIICTIADRFVVRAIPLLACYMSCAIGFILLLSTTQKSARIVGTCLVSAGSYTGVILAATWVMSAHAGYTKRSTTWAMCQLLLQCYSILGSKIYDKPPRFFKGHGILLGLQTLTAACTVLKWWIMRRSNKRKDALRQEYEARGEPIPGVEKSLEELHDDHPTFRYML